jgi:hypothetical protein
VIQGWLKKNSGFTVFTIVSLLSLIRLLKQAVPGHYRVFSGAGHALLNLQNPYANDFGTSVGYYFYSPICGLMVFSPLSLLPEKLGIIVYMTVSWLFFVWGARSFFRAFERRMESPALQWFWVAVTAQMVSGILASKLEILIAGILLLGLAWLTEVRTRLSAKTLASCVLLALALNWKFQPIPVVGLFLLTWVVVLRDWRIPACVLSALGVLYALPYAIFPHERLSVWHETWRSSLSKFVGEAYLDFENLFSFLHNAFGVPLSLLGTQILSGLLGLGFVVFLLAWLKRSKADGASQSQLFRGGVLISTALGTAFMTALSPLGQNNALILYAPLLLVAFISFHFETDARERSHLATSIGMVVAVMTLIYSDLVPVGMRNVLRHLTLKPVACMMLGVVVAHLAWRKRGVFSVSQLPRET